ncbi:MAG: ketoacyl-ACP synthase III [Planctomycetota bacterium]|nr:ketoacyl-ACP synthase III [Planctomycetota bacterium]
MTAATSVTGRRKVGRPAGVRLAGTGMAVPAKVLTNQELATRVDTSDEWITQRTGIRQRHAAAKGEDVRTLSTAAVRQALGEAGMEPKQLDFLIVGTLTPEMVCPSSAARVVADLGAVPAGAVDISAACSGFVYGMNMAAGLIESGFYKTVAVVGAEVLTRLVDWKDRRTCVLFGDGAGAAILTASDDDQQGLLYQTMASNGDGWQELYVPREESDIPPKAEFSGAYNTLQMNGREVYKFAVHTLEKTIDDALNAHGLKASDLAAIIPHQSNARILESARERLGLPPEKLYINIDRYGNTSAASVPICLHELRSAGRLKQGELVLFVAWGGGLTWSSSLWRL